jgi:hypothetical protein
MILVENVRRFAILFHGFSASEGGLHVMSMKRSKQRGATASGRRANDYSGFGNKEKESEKSWKEDVAEQPETMFVPYALTNHYSKGVLLAHPSFGKGLVLNVDGTRLEVLFEEGKKKLGHAAG